LTVGLGLATRKGNEMTIYVAMVKDRHADPEAHLFSTADRAIAFAREYLEGCGDYKRYVDPDDATMSAADLATAGWLFYACYSTEGDCIWVLPREVDES